MSVVDLNIACPMLAWTLEPTTTHCTTMGEYRVSLKNVLVYFTICVDCIVGKDGVGTAG